MPKGPQAGGQKNFWSLPEKEEVLYRATLRPGRNLLKGRYFQASFSGYSSPIYLDLTSEQPKEGGFSGAVLAKQT